jgi:3-hydroxyacyl-[acyl-carrier-protein] dehydratase
MSTALPLPHAYPCLLLDRVRALQPGVSAIAVKALTRLDPLVDARGRLPAALVAEALAQCAGVAVLGTGGPSQHVTVAGIDRFRSRAGPAAGAELVVIVRVVKRFGSVAKVRGVLRVDGRICAAAELVLHLARSDVEARRDGQ